MTTETLNTPRKRSVELTKPERKALKEYRKGFETEVQCATSIGIDRTCSTG
jgi:hypothetical protein